MKKEHASQHMGSGLTFVAWSTEYSPTRKLPLGCCRTEESISLLPQLKRQTSLTQSIFRLSLILILCCQSSVHALVLMQKIVIPQ